MLVCASLSSLFLFNFYALSFSLSLSLSVCSEGWLNDRLWNFVHARNSHSVSHVIRMYGKCSARAPVSSHPVSHAQDDKDDNCDFFLFWFIYAVFRIKNFLLAIQVIISDCLILYQWLPVITSDFKWLPVITSDYNWLQVIKVMRLM